MIRAMNVSRLQSKLGRRGSICGCGTIPSSTWQAGPTITIALTSKSWDTPKMPGLEVETHCLNIQNQEDRLNQFVSVK